MAENPGAVVLAHMSRMPPKARAALLVSALHALTRPQMRENVAETRRRFPSVAGPQLMQQVILDLMGHGLVDTRSATEALIPAAADAQHALAAHLDEAQDGRLEPYSIELWQLIEALFPEAAPTAPQRSPSSSDSADY